MKRNLGLFCAVFLCVCTIAIFYNGRLYANEVGKFDLHGMPGKVVIIERFVFSGGWISFRHRHTGPLFLYVIEGSLTVEMENKQPYTINKGEVFQELPNIVMQARNASSTGVVDFVVFQVSPKGEPSLKRVY